ncbi:MAG TPA: DUF4843 domain-containing protein [Candidatus Alistipes intestinigallinarum]|uniref:DUF4843 domain-containing protein n=1 Tax=Candidatus Alistipes intestinigallinarum TaxID=2838440 RepID=A0A9D1Z048_9BACT|nr:DUF4843 domain-containing protein [Candidatus Alistipes intestinigallinarum]
MKKIGYILLAAAVLAGCEKDDPMRYDMSQGRVCFPGATSNETALYPGYSTADSTFYASLTFKQQPEGAESAVIEVPVKLIGGSSSADREVGFRILDEGTTASASDYTLLGATIPAGETYGAIRIRVVRTPELDSEERALVIELTDSPDLGIGLAGYLKAHVSWHNMLPRPVSTSQWSTYNAFIDSDLASASKVADAYSQAGHQLLVDAFGWETIPNYTSDYSYYLDAWRAKLQDWYDQWKVDNPGQTRVHESGSMKGQEVKVREK